NHALPHAFPFRRSFRLTLRDWKSRHDSARGEQLSYTLHREPAARTEPCDFRYLLLTTLGTMHSGRPHLVNFAHSSPPTGCLGFRHHPRALTTRSAERKSI